MKNIKLFTHNDLDGVMCAYILKIAYPQANISADYCSYQTINTKLYSYLNDKQYRDFDTTFITDISPNENIARWISQTGNIYLFDHHDNLNHLVDKPWAIVRKTHEDGKAACGTSLFHEFLKEQVDATLAAYKLNPTYHNRIIELTRLWDTWEWPKNKDVGMSAVKLNLLLDTFDKQTFLDNVYDVTINRNEDVLQYYKDLVNTAYSKCIDYCERKSWGLIETEFEGHTAGLIFAEQHMSILGEYIFDKCEQDPKYPMFDILLIVNGTYGCSLRTRREIDLSAMAQCYGGGGHKQAAGFNLTKQNQKEYALRIFYEMALKAKSQKK